MANGAGGVLVSSTGHGNVIGTPIVGSTPVPSPAALVNIISGNDGNGVTLAPGASLDAVINNWIGLDITGAGTLPNTGTSIQTNSSYNLVYGNAATGTLPAQSVTGQLEALYVGWFGWAADPEASPPGWRPADRRPAGRFGDAMPPSPFRKTSRTRRRIDLRAARLAGDAGHRPDARADRARQQLHRQDLHQPVRPRGHRRREADVAHGAVRRHGAVLGDGLRHRHSASGSDVTAINSKIDAAAYFTQASDRGPTGIAAVDGVVDTTTALASQAATDALNGSSHQQVDFSSILTSGSITTGVRADLNGAVILTGSDTVSGSSATTAYLYEGPLNDTAAGTKYTLTPVFAGETDHHGDAVRPRHRDLHAVDRHRQRARGRQLPVRRKPVGHLQPRHDVPGPVNGSGGTWTQIDVPTTASTWLAAPCWAARSKTPSCTARWATCRRQLRHGRRHPERGQRLPLQHRHAAVHAARQQRRPRRPDVGLRHLGKRRRQHVLHHRRRHLVDRATASTKPSSRTTTPRPASSPTSVSTPATTSPASSPTSRTSPPCRAATTWSPRPTAARLRQHHA